MAQKIRLTRPELKLQRDLLKRFKRYLPMLKLKQQELQLAIRQIDEELREAAIQVEEQRRYLSQFGGLWAEPAGINFQELSRPIERETDSHNVAGVDVPVFRSLSFPEADYSLFGTPVWADRALADWREGTRREVRYAVLKEARDILHQELLKTLQRVNLFEKVKIPQAQEAIRRIRIQLGDEMTAAVGRAKIAKDKLAKQEAAA